MRNMSGARGDDEAKRQRLHVFQNTAENSFTQRPQEFRHLPGAYKVPHMFYLRCRMLRQNSLIVINKSMKCFGNVGS